MKDYMKNRRLQRRNLLMEMSGNECLICKSKTSLEFDHRDRKTKKFILSGPHLDKKWETILEEHKKCDLLCSSCHKTKTKNCADHNGGHNKNTSPYVCGTVRTYSERKCRCDLCREAKRLSRKKLIGYTDVIAGS